MRLTATFALLAIAQGAALAAASRWPEVAPAYGFVHAGVTIAAMAAQRRHAGRLRKGGVAAWVGAAAGPGGMLAGLAVSAVRHRGPRPLPAPTWLKRRRTEAGERPVSLERLLDARVIHADRASFVSFASVFRQGDVADRTAALSTVVRSFEPRLSPVVARAMADRDGTVRALAASASAEVVTRFRLTRERLRQDAQVSDGAVPRIALLRFLAEHARHNVLLSEPQRAGIAAEAREEGAILMQRLDAGDPLRAEAVTILAGVPERPRTPAPLRVAPLPVSRPTPYRATA